MKGLGKPETFPTPHGVFVLGVTEHVAVFLEPRCVVDFGYDGLHLSAVPAIAIVEAHGVETNAEVPKVGQEPYRPGGALPQALLHQISNRLVQGDTRVAQMISSAKIGQVYPINGPEPPSPEKRGEFLQIQVYHEQPVLKAVQHRTEPAVSHLPFV
jgi:hypothetical protein